MTTHDSKINKVAKLLTDLVFLFFVVVVVVERKSKGSPELRMKGRPRGWLRTIRRRSAEKVWNIWAGWMCWNLAKAVAQNSDAWSGKMHPLVLKELSYLC